MYNMQCDMIEVLCEAVMQADSGGFVRVSKDNFGAPSPQVFRALPRSILAYEVLKTRLPEAAMPLAIECDRLGYLTLTLAGITPISLEREDITDLIARLVECDRILREQGHSDSAETFFVFGHAGHLSPGNRLATIPADIAYSAVMKFRSRFVRDYLVNPRGQLSVNPEKIEMRSLHEWRKIDFAVLNNRAMTSV